MGCFVTVNRRTTSKLSTRDTSGQDADGKDLGYCAMLIESKLFGVCSQQSSSAE
jgi:hypothetical protein